MTVRKKTAKKTVKKKATRAATTTVNRVTLTNGQLNTIANFYTKKGVKVPAFIAKKLNA